MYRSHQIRFPKSDSAVSLLVDMERKNSDSEAQCHRLRGDKKDAVLVTKLPIRNRAM